MAESKDTKFEVPKMMLLERSDRAEQYGPENPYHCTFKACCYEGK